MPLVIEFHLDNRSGVPAYLQLVQQVRHAIRLGMLRPGDQLPTVKEVVASLTINPNTVLHAYRQLDWNGWSRAGVVWAPLWQRTPRLSPPDEAEDPALVARSLGRSRPGGRPRRREHVGAVRRVGAPGGRFEGGGMSEATRPRSHASGLGKRYGATWALRDCTLEIPTGSVTALVGPNGAGKTTLLHLVIGLATADGRDGRGARSLAAPMTRTRCCRGSGSSRRITRSIAA